MDGSVPPDAEDSGLRQRRPERSDLQEAVGLDTQTQHLSVGKEIGETAHMERWNNTLRQRVGHMVRKALSFSKDTD